MFKFFTKIKKYFLCEHSYIWVDKWVSEYNDKIIIDEFKCNACGKTKMTSTFEKDFDGVL
jgi:hypothetical protein